MDRPPPWYALGGAAFLAGEAMGQHGLADIGLHTPLSVTLASGVTTALKHVAGRRRPYERFDQGVETVVSFHDPLDWQLFEGWEDPSRHSYPSAHTTVMFAVASALSEEWGGLAPWVAFAVASGVAWSRLNDNVHWSTDVVMGSVVVIFSGRFVVRYAHRQGDPLERWLLFDRDPRSDVTRVGFRVALPF